MRYQISNFIFSPLQATFTNLLIHTLLSVFLLFHFVSLLFLMAQYGKTTWFRDPEPFGKLSVISYLLNQSVIVTFVTLLYLDWYQRYSGIRDLINQVNIENTSITCANKTHCILFFYSTSSEKILSWWLDAVILDLLRICLKMVNFLIIWDRLRLTYKSRVHFDNKHRCFKGCDWSNAGEISR